MSFYHEAVMAREVVDLLTKGGTRGGLMVDATLGGGSHSEALLRSRIDVQVVGLDQDPQALQAAVSRLSEFGERFDVRHLNFRRMVQQVEVGTVRGVVMDLGVSSHQLDTGERGFSFQRDGPLDMRMDPIAKLNAAENINGWSESELSRIFWEFGEERFSRQVAKAIAEARKHRSIRTTGELAAVIEGVIWRRGKIHPATRVFQGLRLAVNDELGALSEGLESAWQCIGPGGRMVVISFHSLEDRIVKNRFRKWEREEGIGKLLNKKPMEPGEDEMKKNPRSRSAKLRAIEKS
jgi:16S rRNA (cytosine1402-N4)-methyltransferase